MAAPIYARYVGDGDGQGIISINGDVTPAQLIVGGSGITVATVAGTTTVSATGSGGGITSINTDTTAAQLLVVGSSGTDFAIVDNGTGTHTFNLPNASGTARGVVSTGTQAFAGNKTFNDIVTLGATGTTNTHILNGFLQMNAGAGAHTDIFMGVSDGALYIYADTSAAGTSGQFRLYGSTHATKPKVTEFLNNGSISGSISSAGLWTIAGSISLGTQLSLADGSVGAPAIIFTSDTTTGIYRSGAAEIAFSSAGVLASKFFSGSDVGVLQLHSASATGRGQIETTRSDTGIYITGDTGSANGGQLRVYGNSNGSKPNYIEFTKGNTVNGFIDGTGTWTIGPSGTTNTHALNGFLQMNAGSAGTTFLFNAVQNAAMFIIADTGSSAGAQFRLYGSTHATKANVTEFTKGATINGSIDANGLWTIGTTGSSQVHSVNGTMLITNGVNQPGFKITGTNTNLVEINIANSLTGGQNWRLCSTGTDWAASVGSFLIRNGTGSVPFFINQENSILIGGLAANVPNGTNTALALQPLPDVTNIGGTTSANASTTITGSGTKFTQLGVGDRISLSSASGTYATILTIVSDTSLTVDIALGNGTSQTINRKRGIFRVLNASANQVFFINDAGSTILGGAALSTSATDGFTYIPSCAGTPTGVPTAHAGTLPMVYDSSGNFLYIYNGAWKKAAFI